MAGIKELIINNTIMKTTIIRVSCRKDESHNNLLIHLNFTEDVYREIYDTCKFCKVDIRQADIAKLQESRSYIEIEL